MVGVTGGIGAGKSIVCKIFETLGATAYYADDRAKALMNEDDVLVKQLKLLFGENTYVKGQLNRQWISEQVFDNKDLLDKLNQAVHPAVRSDFEHWVRRNSDASLLLKEAALLFETGSYKELDYTILVVADQDLRVKRVMERDPQRTQKTVKSIMAQQLSDEQKLPLADFIVDNNEKRSVIKQASHIYEALT